MDQENPVNLVTQQTQENSISNEPQQDVTGFTPQQTPEMPSSNKKSSNVLLIILGVSVALLLVAAIACVITFGKTENKESENATGETTQEESWEDEPENALSLEEAIARTEEKYTSLKFAKKKETRTDEYEVYCQRFVSPLDDKEVYYVYSKNAAGCATVGSATDYVDRLMFGSVDGEQEKLSGALSRYMVAVLNYQSNNNGRTPFVNVQPGFIFNRNNKFIIRYIDPEGNEDVSLQYLGSTDDLKGNTLLGVSSSAPKSLEDVDNRVYAITKAQCSAIDGQFTVADSENEVALFILLGDGKVDCRDE